ncbi:MAG: heterodisulfide reductase-related iron-sulfur binding cluster [Anaerolineales bacterium]
MPERMEFWGIPHTWGNPTIYVYTLMGLAALVLLWRFYLRASLWWKIGRPESRWDRPFLRLWNVLRDAIAQTKVLRQRYPGLMHLGLAWSFFVFFLGTALATLDAHFFKFLQGNLYLAYKFTLDIFTLFFLVGAGMAFYRRILQRPARLTLAPGFTWSLALITLIVLAGLLTESLRLAVERPAWGWWMPAGFFLAQVWMASGASENALISWHLALWIFHLLIVSVTLMTLPTGTLLHILTAPLNIFFARLDKPTGRLAPVPVTAKGTILYLRTLRDLPWSQLLQAEACTECGRCQEACPAHTSGTACNPKGLMLDLRAALRHNGKAALTGKHIEPSALWACTTCGACRQECPVLIEHPDLIVDLRRTLIMDGRVDPELQKALDNLGRYGNSFGQSPRMRARWSQGLSPIPDLRRQPAQTLWFVGDYASYSATLTEITRKTAEVFRHAGLDFGILHDAEQNAGNDVRRVGEEGLFEMLVEKNLSTLERCQFERVVTTDPHTFNTLKNEYPDEWRARHEILHYASLLDDWLATGKLTLSRRLGYTVTYHDPCYLGRYNSVYEAPRRVIAATGCKLVEMPRHAERAYCCGAGGGRIWMQEEKTSERPSESRIREAAALNGVEALVVACPKDVTMYRDAIKTTGNESRLRVLDLTELVYEAL